MIILSQHSRFIKLNYAVFYATIGLGVMHMKIVLTDAQTVVDKLVTAEPLR